MRITTEHYRKTSVYLKYIKMDSSLEIEQHEQIVAKFNVKSKPLYIKVLWKNNAEDLFLIKVFYEDNTWTGKYSNELAANRRERLDETEEEYNRNVKNCLSGESKEYIYDFAASPDDINSASFIWKKQYDGAVKTQGVVPLRKDEAPTSKDTLIDILLQKNINLISEVKLANETNNELKQNLEQYIQRLEELTQSKILLESTLYGRFVQVLNEKKRRIRLLEEHFESLKAPK